MKKSTLRIEEQQPRNIQRADIAPEAGYAMVVDGHFKNHFSEESAAKEVATKLLARYPMLRVEIYDAVTKTRKKVEHSKALVD
jgi:recombinational DNA repair protein RecT